MCVSITRVNLNGQWSLGKKQLKQQSRVWRFHIGTLKPKFADSDTVSLDIAPRQKVCASPRLAHNPRAGMFDRQDVLLFAPSGIVPADAGRIPIFGRRVCEGATGEKERDRSPSRRRPS